ncbi:MAG: hypothetical protein ACE5J3_01990 [Methanosarcinales archaeon]
MESKELILKEIEIIRFLEAKALEQRIENSFASESSLKKDWLRLGEDEAWKDL